MKKITFTWLRLLQLLRNLLLQLRFPFMMILGECSGRRASSDSHRSLHSASNWSFFSFSMHNTGLHHWTSEAEC
ncbi:unnamed protein product [Trifolium pratense]|uniref:Uncharacterized protein n=1 Tax=Trifolium pratense TaxID=57577 RepID=A0ACB0M338_TRIPR|nr:unnamed protein product [Trifolium pratense]